MNDDMKTPAELDTSRLTGHPMAPNRDGEDINAGISPARNHGTEPTTVFDEPTWAPSPEESDHPELWEMPYLWRPDTPHRPEAEPGIDPEHVEANAETPFPPAAEAAPDGAKLRLAQRMTDRIGHAVRTTDPEYWGFYSWVTDDMKKVVRRMKVRVPMTLPALAKACRMTEDEVKPIIDHMAQAGLVEYNWENDRHEKQWVLPVQLPGMGEFYAMNQHMEQDHPEMATYFERVAFVGPAMVAPMVPPGGAGLGMHVIPVESSISSATTSVDVEHISHWLKKYDKFASSTCSCRMSETIRGLNAGADPEGWCIGVGDMADYEVQTGKGRYISYDEAMAIIRHAEELGFMHQITNIDGEDKIFAICNCDKSVCYGLRTSQLFNTPNFSRSAYIAKVDPDKCVACGQCVENCPAGAVKLGQRLCTKHGKVEYPQRELPDETEWGPDKWDLDYREHNRIETYDSGTAPCKVACPAHIAIEGYLDLAKQGKYTDALALIKKENPFPAVCGRVCNHLCEDACTRGTLDDPVSIEAVKRFLADRDLDAETRFVPPVRQPSLRGPYTEKVAIVGAGPAGLSCAYYLAEMGYTPTVFEKRPLPGGMMTYGIPSYKLEKDVVAAEIDVLRELGVEIRCGVEVGRGVSLDDLRAQGYKAFYLAIGAQKGRLAGIPGEEGADVVTAVDLLADMLGSENVRLPGRTVVVGGGNVAIDAARGALRCGSDEVTMWCLEGESEMPATPEEVREATEDGVAIRSGWGPASVERDADGKLLGITFKRCTRVFDDEGRFSPAYDEQDTRYVEADHVIMSIGQAIDWGTLLDGTKVELGRGARAEADAQTYQTAEPDIFVGGDDFTGPKFVIDAIAAGHEAAISIHRFVQPGNSLTRGRNPRRYVSLDKDDIVVDAYDGAPRQKQGIDPNFDIHRTLRDWHLDLTPEQVRTECQRCLRCGASVVDPHQCVGCGLCTTKCEFDAIHLTREIPEASVMMKNEDKLKGILPYALKREVKILKKKAAKS